MIEHDETQASEILEKNQKFSQWQSLSPWSMLSFSFGTAKAILSNGYAIIPIVFAGWKNGFNLQLGLIAAIIMMTLLSVFAFIQWRKYRFKLNEQQLNIKRGLLFTRKDEIPFNKIQNIRFEQPFYFKPLKLGTLVIETAGSKDDEAHLAALNADDAELIKQQLLQLTNTSPRSINPNNEASFNDKHIVDIDSADTNAQLTSSKNKPVIKRNLKQLIQFGFYQNNLIWLAVIAGPILGQVNWEDIAEMPLIQQFWNSVVSFSGESIALQVASGVLIFITIYCLFSLISILAAVLKYYPYRLDKRQQTLQRSGGVISHQQDALATKRVQLLHFSQPVLARIFGVWTLYLKQVKGQEVEQKTAQHMLIPSIKAAEIAPVLDKIPELAGGSTSIPKRYQNIALAWFTRRGFIAFLPAIILTAIEGITVLTEITWLIALAVMGLTFLRYKQWGYVIENDVVWQHCGLFSRNWKRVPFSKVQHVSITQTLAQKEKGFAYITLGLASGSLTLPYIKQQDAHFIAEQAMARTKIDPNNWI
ncbi:PH domain-containing protein [Shewanella goraebulensis]|uniref:PH domain-containing protein n=1 Tax=Shewanella goraebulensis TaxID=3050637 RepID=UPI0025518BA3|nr:PH domain-containing protein [Shewanella goraebulensis]